jgi:hypothetical protein
MVLTGVCRAYCHKIIKLSGALQEFAAEKEVVCNVHGKRLSCHLAICLSVALSAQQFAH